MITYKNWKIRKKYFHVRKTWKISIIKEGENSFLSPENSLKSLMTTHFEEHATQKVDTVLTTLVVDTDTNLQQVVEYIDKLKVARAISSFGPLKATGPDELHPIVLQMSSIGFIRYLTNIYKQVLITGYSTLRTNGEKWG